MNHVNAAAAGDKGPPAIGIGRFEIIRHGVDDDPGHLGAARAVEIDIRPVAVIALIQGRKLAS